MEMVMRSDVGDPQILSKRLGSFLRAQGSAKDVARRIKADERTVENIRAGRSWPIARHWLNIWVEFGDDVLEAVFHPERVEARLLREAEERDRARQQRIAASLVEHHALGMPSRVGQGAGADENAAPVEPANLDLFEPEHP